MTPYHPLTAIIMEAFPEWILLSPGNVGRSDTLRNNSHRLRIYVHLNHVLLDTGTAPPYLVCSRDECLNFEYGPLEDPGTDLTAMFEAIKEMGKK